MCKVLGLSFSKCQVSISYYYIIRCVCACTDVCTQGFVQVSRTWCLLAIPAVLCLALMPSPLQAQVGGRAKEEWTVGHLPPSSPIWLGHLALPTAQ